MGYAHLKKRRVVLSAALEYFELASEWKGATALSIFVKIATSVGVGGAYARTKD